MPQVPYVAATYTTSVTAAQLNHLEQGANDLSYAPAVRVTHNTTQSVTSGTPLAVTFNTERFDQAGNAGDNMHDNTNPTRLTCRYAGVYQITGNIQYASSPQVTNLSIRLNGATTIARHGYLAGTALDVRNQHITTLYLLAVNDYVELMASQTSGAGVNISNVGNESPEFMMVRVG